MDKQDELFPILTADQLECARPYARELTLAQGEVLFREGASEHEFYILLSGDLKVTRDVAGGEVLLRVHHAGEFTGALTLLTGGESIATGRALSPMRLLCIDVEAFKTMMTACPSLSVLILTTMAQRRPEADTLTRQREKLAALGKLSAGLAHELNNPAAAARRAAGQLAETFDALQPLALTLGELCLSHGQRDFLVDFQRALRDRLGAHVPLDPLAQSDREEALTDWLESHGFAEPWTLAPTLVEAGLDVTQLNALAEHVDAAMPVVLSWLTKSLAASCLLREIDQSTGRVGELVKAIKSYSYMDQAPQQDVDVHEGLDSTLTILGHKLKHGVSITRDFDRTLPTIPAYGSELNQVWTNLIDNAVDAMGGQGRLTLRTSRENDRLLVEIVDDGPGVPPEIQSHLFEPFFTTKGVGQGTGLGLDTSRKIVVDRHHGDICVESRPGETRFQVRLPLTKPGELHA